MTLSRATTPRQALESYCRDQGVTPTVAVETNHEGGYIQLVQSGAGVAMLSQASARLAIRLGIEVRALDPPLSLPVVLVHRRDTLSPAARAFVEIARQHRETSPGVGES